MKSLVDKRYYALKIMKKGKIVKAQQLEHCQNELRILSRLRCKYTTELYAFFQDENSIYFLLEYIPGGELFSHLRKAGRFELSLYQFYSVEVACALSYLHTLKIVCRDIKPENILITAVGHIRINEFSLAKIVEDRTYTLCGTPEYISPEVIEGNGYGTATDWWAFGVLLYEMAVGYPPFFGKNPFTIYKKILDCKVDYPSHLPASTKAAIKAFLTFDRRSRLGSGSGGFKSVKRNAFFKGIDWNSAIQELIIPPVIPTVTSEGDSSNYDFYPDETIDEPSNLNYEERQLFTVFDEILDRPKQF